MAIDCIAFSIFSNQGVDMASYFLWSLGFY